MDEKPQVHGFYRIKRPDGSILDKPNITPFGSEELLKSVVGIRKSGETRITVDGNPIGLNEDEIRKDLKTLVEEIFRRETHEGKTQRTRRRSVA